MTSNKNTLSGDQLIIIRKEILKLTEKRIALVERNNSSRIDEP